MRKYLFGLLFAAFALVSCQTATAQAGGITKNGKTMTWKFADSIPASTVSLFPSFFAAAIDSGDVVQLKNFYSELTVDTLGSAFTTYSINSPSYFKGGERLFLSLPKATGLKQVVLYQPSPGVRDTIAADSTKARQVEWYYNTSKFKPLSK